MRLRTLSAAMLALIWVAGGCGGEDNPTNNDEVKTGAPNQVDAKVNGAGGSTIKGNADQTVPQQFVGAVTNGELTVYLADGAAGSVIFFRTDTTKVDVPGKVTPAKDLGGLAYLSITSTSGIFESDGRGTITINQCPDAKGTIISGAFNAVGLTSPLGGSSELSGTFQVKIALHDGSHKCVANNKSKFKSPPNCGVSTCDGPCCPYQACMATCTLGCMQTKCTGMDVMGCISCINACPNKCGISAACKSAYAALNACADKFQCDPAPPEESACIGTNCCAEFKAAF